jgi:hypothetical protein
MQGDYAKIIDRLTELGLHEEAFSVGVLGLEAKRMRITLDEIAADAWEDANLTELQIQRKEKRFVPTVIYGGRA